MLVIPNHKGSIKSTPPLDGLRGFDSKSFAIPKGDTTTRRMTKANDRPVYTYDAADVRQVYTSL